MTFGGLGRTLKKGGECSKTSTQIGIRSVGIYKWVSSRQRWEQLVTSEKQNEQARSVFQKTERGTNDPERISSTFRDLERKILKNR